MLLTVLSLCLFRYHVVRFWLATTSPLTLVGLMYHVIALHAWLSPGTSRWACLDRDHTGVVYAPTELQGLPNRLLGRPGQPR